MQQILDRVPSLTAAETIMQQSHHAMNDRGIRIDAEGAEVLLKIGDLAIERLNVILKNLTDGKIQTVGQVAKIAEYCGTHSAAEPNLVNLLEEGKLNERQRAVARCRLAGAKSSARKLPKMLDSRLDDGRSRGVFIFHGTVTGRWAGRVWQPQNLPRDCFKPAGVDACLSVAREAETLREFADHYKDPMGAISKCLRGLIVPDPGNEFIIADYSQIEARMVAWYAGQDDILEVYRKGGGCL